jgi:AAHS family benzoate transporter-like MFS transporter
MASYGFFGNVIGAIGFGTLSDRIGRKNSLLLALVVFSVFSGLAFWSPGFESFCILRLIAGLGLGGALPLSVALISEFSPARIRAKVLTGTFMGFTGGWAVAAAVPMYVIPLYGWRMVFLLGFFPILFVPVLWAYLPESVRFLSSRKRYEDLKKEVRRVENTAGLPHASWTTDQLGIAQGKAQAGFKKLFTSSAIYMTILIWLTYFCTLMALFGLSTWLPQLLMKSGFSLAKSFSFGLIQALGAMAGGIFVGSLMDKFGRKGALVASFIAGGISVIVLGMTTSVLWLYVMAWFFGMFIISSPTMLHVVAAEIYPTEIRATGTGWAVTIGKLGPVIAPPLLGGMMIAGISFLQFCLVISIPCFICAILVMLYRANIKGETLETSVKLMTE